MHHVHVHLVPVYTYTYMYMHTHRPVFSLLVVLWVVVMRDIVTCAHSWIMPNSVGRTACMASIMQYRKRERERERETKVGFLFGVTIRGGSTMPNKYTEHLPLQCSYTPLVDLLCAHSNGTHPTAG